MDEGGELPTCNGMLRKLQGVWEEIGESESEMDSQLLQLEARCFAIYEEAVSLAKQRRDELNGFINDALSDIQSMQVSLGEDKDQMLQLQGPLLEQVAAIEPNLLSVRERVSNRRAEFDAVRTQIRDLRLQLAGNPEAADNEEDDMNDLTNQHLNQLENISKSLLETKRERVVQVRELVEASRGLCRVLGLSTKEVLGAVHESLSHERLEVICVNDTTMAMLNRTVDSLRKERQLRIEKLSDLGSTIVRLCDLLELSDDEKPTALMDFGVYVDASSSEIISDRSLSAAKIEAATEEVNRLESLKVIKIKELVFKKRAKIEEICESAHLLPPSNTSIEILTQIIENQLEDPMDLLAKLEEEVVCLMEEKKRRQDILEAVDRWQKVCREEVWLDDFEQDNNRYAPQRGQHLMLQRAEAARKDIKKLPDIVKALQLRVKGWEEQHGQEFLFDGEGLIALLTEDMNIRAHREAEKKKLLELTREEKRRVAEEEAKFGTRATPRRTAKSVVGTPGTSDRRLSVAGAGNHSQTMPTPDRRLSMGPAPPKNRIPPSTLKKDRPRIVAPNNVVSLQREDPSDTRLPLSPLLANQQTPAGSKWDPSGIVSSKPVDEINPRYLEY